MGTRVPGVVIVGASAAGLAAADGLREGGYEGPITVLDEELISSYDRPMLSKSLLGSKEDAEPTPLRTMEQLQERRIDVQTGHGATGLDIDRRFVITNYGEALPFRDVVVASGARARPMLTTSGTLIPTLRTVADLGAIRSLAASGRPVTVIGSGFIGLEVAAALRSRGIDVTLLGSGSRPLHGVLGDAVSDWLLDAHRTNGVDLTSRSPAVAVRATDTGYDIELADSTHRTAELLIAGIGAIPGADWLVGSGVELGGGVLTDPAGRTNVPRVWAAGDVANTLDAHTGLHRRTEHWTHATNQGRHVGLNIARGRAEPFTAVPYLWTEQYGLKIHVLGERRSGDEDVVVEGDLESGDFVLVHGADDELHSVTISGRLRALATYRKLLRQGASMTEATSAVTPA
ncbi:MAG: NAD(P)/FAD-dependent oxidoreductase [Intrasporangium sp.]|uniref:NAD(P)/FAD-dependent oxidoreductase n=1 Tax=Intrasporangium sp. TaxID=1925024 RepID=UPI002648A79B|nr:FAD/NAD(P)-binding oxidoreductase [Intrasporangium sp.]MDN5796415.1 NAD(P)/FAD-dependent oxidoreductase [Intrasporangium sp.]